MKSTHDPRRRIPGSAELSDVFRAYPVGVAELLTIHALVLRHPAPFTVAEREPRFWCTGGTRKQAVRRL